MSEPTAAPANGAFDSTLLGTIQRDVPYCQPGTANGLHDSAHWMDIYYPNTGEAPFPTVMYVHGGSWVTGNKSEGRAIPRQTELVEGGNIFVSINYRLAPEHKFPAQIEDVKCAVRALRANAQAWGIDPERIAAMGSSAGGHLVSLLGVSDAQSAWDTYGGFAGVSSRVQAVVDLFGPAVPEGTLRSGDLDLLRQVFGARSIDDDVLRQASPATYATKDDPPFLILHGTRDTTVPLSQSQRLAEVLQASGIDTNLIVVENAGHGIPVPGHATRPTFPEIMLQIQGFLERNIGRQSG